MAKYKIIDGGGYGKDEVKIFDADGNDITKHVRCYTVRHEVGQMPTFTLEMYGANLEVKTDATFVTVEKLITDTTALGDEYRSHAVVQKANI